MTYQLAQVIREATRRWKVCVHGPEATCQTSEAGYPRVWCDACVARALLDVAVTAPDAEPEPRRGHPRMVEAQRRRRAEERKAATDAQVAREAGR